MSRMSAEARGASAYRAGGEPPAVPADFSKEAADIWHEIVSAKPVDWFDGGSLGLLRQFCRTMAEAERVASTLDNSSVAGVEREVLQRQLVALNGNCTTIATKLRITVQMQVSSESGMVAEKAAKKVDNNLLGGGNYVWPESERLKAA